MYKSSGWKSSVTLKKTEKQKKSTFLTANQMFISKKKRRSTDIALLGETLIKPCLA
jgi:hypothetical protein